MSKNIYEPEYYCPNCNDILNQQDGFSPDDVWICKNCGMHLYGEDVYGGVRFEGVVWYCDECKSVLNKQGGFSDVFDYWTCTNCGHLNRINENEIYESEEEYEEDDDQDDYDYGWDYDDDEDEEVEDDEEDDDDECTEFESYVYSESAQASTPSEPPKPVTMCFLFGILGGLIYTTSVFDSSSLHWGLTVVIGIVICIIITAVLYGVYSLIKVIEEHPIISVIIAFLIIAIGYGSYSLVMDNKMVYSPITGRDLYNETYIDLREIFRDAGFVNVTYNDIDDLLTSEIDKESIVTEVSIDGKTNFSKGDEFSATDEVIITFHSPAFIDCPISAKEAKGKNYIEVQSQFKDAGFTNIRVQKNDKWLEGVFRDNNEILGISVDGNTSFEYGDNFIKDVEVVITYYKKE